MKEYKNVFNEGYNYRGIEVSTVEELDEAKKELFIRNKYYNSDDLAEYIEERRKIIEDYYMVKHLIIEGEKIRLRLEKIHNMSLEERIYNTAKELFNKTNLQLQEIDV